MHAPSPARLAAMCLALLASCKRDNPSPDPSSQPGHAVKVSDTAPSSAPSSQPVVEKGPLPTRTEPDAKPTYLVAMRESDWAGFGPQKSYWFRVFDVEGRIVAMHGGYTFLHDGKALKLDTKVITTGPVSGAYAVTRLEGRWPDDLFADASFYNFMGPRQMTSYEASYRRAAGKWEKVPKAPTAAAAWRGGTLLGINNEKLEVLAGLAPTQMPKQTDGPSSCGAGKALVVPERIAAFATGEVIVLGKRCDTGAYAIERWAAGSEQGKVEVLDGAPTEAPEAERFERRSVQLVASSPTQAHVAISTPKAAYLASVTASGSRPIVVPEDGLVLGASATPDGTLWLLVSPDRKGERATLLRLSSGGTFTRYLPPKLGAARAALDHVAALDHERAYIGSSISVKEGTFAVVIGTVKEKLLGNVPDDPDAQFAKPADPAPAASAAASATPPPLYPPHNASCKTPFVVIFDVSKNAPADFTFPTTRKALSSFTKLSDIKVTEFTHRDKRRLGAKVPSAQVGEQLVAHIKATMKDESPELVCFAPSEGLREIKVE